MKTRYKIIIGICVACLVVAADIWMEVRTGRQMRAAVEQALEQNRYYVPFTSDTIYLSPHSSPTSTPFPSGDGRGEAISLRDAVAYYRHPLRRLWTSPNDLLRAGYALGCVYRDLHEAPIAIITWEEAVAAADTTADDCDYATLYRVYGQMASLYMWQHLPEKQLSCEKCYSKYALLVGDTLESLHGVLLSNSAYYALGDTAAIFANSEAVRQQYLKLGLTKEAAKVYPTPIQIAVETGQFERARVMMDEYEHNSDLFNEDGFIKDSTRAQYHSYKGHYYLGIHEIDSAELQFRKLLLDSIHFIDACRGLFKLYQLKNNADSAYKFGRLYEEAMCRFIDNQHGEAIIHAEGMYNYTRQKELAQKQTARAGRFRLTLICVLAIMLIAVLFTLRYRQKNNAEKASLMARYSKAADELDAARHDLQILNQSISKDNAITKLLKEKEELIALLESTVRSLQEQIGLSQDIVQSRKVEESEIIQHFHLIAQQHCVNKNGTAQREKPRAATTEEWAKLVEAVQQYHPAFYLFIVNRKLSALKFKVSILSFLGFDNHEITILTNANKGSIPNARTSLAKELFGLSSAHELDDHLRQIEPPS